MIDRFKRIVPKIITDVLRQVEEAQLLKTASSLAYTTILSLIPALALSFSIFHIFGGMQKLYDTLEPFIIENLAEGTSDQVMATIHSIIDNINVKTVGIGGLIGLAFTSMSMLSSMEKAINQIWHTKNNRKFWRSWVAYTLIVLIGPIALVVVFGIVASGVIPFSRILPTWSGTFFAGMVIFFLIYQYLPARKVLWKYSLLSAGLTSAFWTLARAAYSYYTHHIVYYHEIYGSLGAVPILLLWIYIVWVITLLGAALSAVLQNRFESARKSV